ncbi:hypothetical protein [Amorphus orientalis]|uniref:Uncharacterized protein n=1 Tax=Amorphus orientalis TaxID=649198 RepID=A0AAE3VQ26_9HYPH|nr:hypothetical protein [Amorphus orientalis]MDQ0316051.1 hypothetical protein [Amorphus orientalis]
MVMVFRLSDRGRGRCPGEHSAGLPVEARTPALSYENDGLSAIVSAANVSPAGAGSDLDCDTRAVLADDSGRRPALQQPALSRAAASHARKTPAAGSDAGVSKIVGFEGSGRSKS